MDALEYLKEKNRMCYRNSEYQHCSICPFESECCQCEDDRPEEAVRIVEEWSKAHPKQTNADKFKEVFGVEPVDCQGETFAMPTGKGIPCSECKNWTNPDVYNCVDYGGAWWDAPYEAPKGAQ